MQYVLLEHIKQEMNVNLVYSLAKIVLDLKHNVQVVLMVSCLFLALAKHVKQIAQLVLDPLQLAQVVQVLNPICITMYAMILVQEVHTLLHQVHVHLVQALVTLVLGLLQTAQAASMIHLFFTIIPVMRSVQKARIPLHQALVQVNLSKMKLLIKF